MTGQKLARIAVVTSGGDAPGLNACLRAVVRTALTYKLAIFGIRHGYEGLMKGDFIPLDGHSVSGIINRGGTFLFTTRTKTFETPAGIRKAAGVLKKRKIDGLIVLGGNGSLKGACELAQETGTAVIGIPKSIDNDVGGTDYSIGFDTAVNTAVEVIDKLRDTATSHERLFFVEVMGRRRGFLALATALAGGAEAVLLPEIKQDTSSLCKLLEQGKKHGKVSNIIIVAEGDESGGALKVAKKISKSTDYDVRVSIIGHQQRGGAPSAFDRILASQFGNAAVEALLQGEHNKMVGIQNGEIVIVPLDFSWKIDKPLDAGLVRLSEVLSR